YGPSGLTVVPVSVKVTKPEVGSGASQSFEVVNLTQHDLKFVGYAGKGASFVEKTPPLGTVLHPADVASFDIGYVVLGSADHPVTVNFETSTGQRFSAVLTSSDQGGKAVGCGVSDGGTCSTSGNSIVNFLDNPNTVITLAPADAVNLVNLCG